MSASVDPIVIKGSHFFYKTNGTQFFLRGVAYQSQTTNDVLADEAGCHRDIPAMLNLGINLVRVYSVDPTQDHTACMNLFANNEIYVLIDLPTASQNISISSPTWDNDKYAAYTSVVDDLAGYTNVIGFNAADEAINSTATTDLAPAVKAAARDVKAYIKSMNYRQIPVGYASDEDATRHIFFNYLSCGDSSTTIDFWGLNNFAWCGDSTFTASGYSQLTTDFKNSSVPIFFSEYGCDETSPRKFTEVQAIYGSQMSPYWSGGIVYQWTQINNAFGLVNISGSSITKLTDYNNLSSQLASATPSATQMSTYTPSNTVTPSCPTADSTWQASPTLPPLPNQQLCTCMTNSVSCIASSDLSNTDISSVLSQVCEDANNCIGVQSNGTTGTYGAYSICSTSQQISWALNQYYISQGNKSSACTMNSAGTVQTPLALNSTCSTLLSEAGPLGDKVVVPTSVESPTHTASSSNTATVPNQTGINTPSSKSGISSGAIAGTVIGVLAFLALFGLGIFFLFRRRKIKYSKANTVPPVDPVDLSPEGLEVRVGPPSENGRKVELPTSARTTEIAEPGDHQNSTMSGAVPSVELSGESGRNRQLSAATAAASPSPVSQTAMTERNSPVSAGTPNGVPNGSETASAPGSPIPPPVRPATIARNDSQPRFESNWGNAPWFDPSDPLQALSEHDHSRSSR